MSGLGIDWSLVVGAIAFAVIITPWWVWRRLLRFARKASRKQWRRVRRPRPARAHRTSQPEVSVSSAAIVLSRFWVIDGDTIQDNTTNKIYRLENIDCPETETRALCYREREMGKRAKFEAFRLLKGATTIIARPTGKIDSYGRSIASIDVDGNDFGQLMIERGFARPWRGVREDWCGPNGGLALMAKACSAKFHCSTCGGRAGDV